VLVWHVIIHDMCISPTVLYNSQGTEVLTPRAPLRESNDGASVQKVSTPSHMKSFFMTKNR
jgi:hypothetical protein